MCHLRSIRPYQVVLLGGFVLGISDLLFARIYWASEGLTTARILQAIASGIYGKESFERGTETAVIGAVAHFFIATCMVLAYFLASAKSSALRRHPLVCGLLYGVVLYLFMNLVVLPLSAAGPPSFANTSWVAWSVTMHASFGILCAVVSRLARGRMVAGSV